MTMFLHYFIENLQVSIYFCLFYHLFGTESFFFPGIVFSYSFRYTGYVGCFFL